MSAGETFGSAASYDRLMGRYGTELAPVVADRAGRDGRPADPRRRLRGPARSPPSWWPGWDPTPCVASIRRPPQADACRARLPGVRRRGRCRRGACPYGDGTFDANTLSQLVVHFFADADRAMVEMRRVTRGGGAICAVGWDADDGMVLLREAHAAARDTDTDVRRVIAMNEPLAREPDLVGLFERAGLVDVSVGPIDVVGRYSGPDDLVAGLRSGVGPVGRYVAGLPVARQQVFVDAVLARLGVPDHPFELPARAWCALGRVPG